LSGLFTHPHELFKPLPEGYSPKVKEKYWLPNHPHLLAWYSVEANVNDPRPNVVG
jgi:hypothetical protein